VVARDSPLSRVILGVGRNISPSVQAGSLVVQLLAVGAQVLPPVAAQPPDAGVMSEAAVASKQTQEEAGGIGFCREGRGPQMRPPPLFMRTVAGVVAPVRPVDRSMRWLPLFGGMAEEAAPQAEGGRRVVGEGECERWPREEEEEEESYKKRPKRRRKQFG